MPGRCSPASSSIISPDTSSKDSCRKANVIPDDAGVPLTWPESITRILRTKQSRWIPSDPMRRRTGSVYLFSHSRPCRKPRADSHPRHRRLHCRCQAAAGSIRPAQNSESTTGADITTMISYIPPTDGMSDVLLLSTNTTNTATSSDVDSINTCSHCGRTFPRRIGLIGHLRIHRTETQMLVFLF
nr:unnamed protein product [Spirometra erinaceieuropaei]